MLSSRKSSFPNWDRPRVMGIVNINDDSFSGDGTLDVDVAFGQAQQMLADGAGIIDVGAESARTNREAISAAEEIERLVPFIDKWVQQDVAGLPSKPLLSVNTWRPTVIEAVLKTQAIDLINDISGLPDATNAKLCAEYGATLLIMHTVGLPKVPHLSQRYEDIWAAIVEFFEEKVQLAKVSGLKDHQIMLDPGIDFAKQRDDNLLIYRDLEKLTGLGAYPVLLPISRKTVIGEVLDLPDPVNRDAGTIACLARGIRAGAKVFRVHNVRAAVGSLQVLDAISDLGNSVR